MLTPVSLFVELIGYEDAAEQRDAGAVERVLWDGHQDPVAEAVAADRQLQPQPHLAASSGSSKGSKGNSEQGA